MEREESDTDHTVDSCCQGMLLSYSPLNMGNSTHKIVTLGFSGIQPPISHHSQNEKSIKRLPKRDLSTDSLDEKHAASNKKQSHTIQVSSTTTQNGETMIENGPLHDTEAQYHNQKYTVPTNVTNVLHVTNIIYPHKQPNMPDDHLKHYDFTHVRANLATYYKKHLEIQRVLGENLDLEKCFVNLAIVEAIHQHQIDREQLKKLSESFIRMHSYEEVRGTNLKSTIQIEDLFNKRKLRDEKDDIPRKILIHGRAGIGKTTFCKKLVHLFVNGRWNDRFNAVIWIPLRQLKSHKSRNLEKLLKEKYFTFHPKHEKVYLTDVLMQGINKVLFVLDGLDEIISDAQGEDPIGSFVKYLLNQSHVVITSRPSGIDKSILPAFDLELETVGFSSTNISDYVNNVLDGKAATSVMDFIQKTPVVQTLANIPVQLDVICYSWESLPKDENMVTVTTLYQSMVDKLWRKDGVLLEKSEYGKVVSINLMKRAQEYQISRLMSREIEYLSYLAFIGMKKNQIEFDNHIMEEAVKKLDHFGGQTLQDQLPLRHLEIIKQTSFLHAVQDNIDSQHDLTQQSYHFIHLTFQEFFAATWLLKYFQSKQANSLTSSKLMDIDETMAFIRQNKYNPRYEIVWWMIA
ncbi:hypothetical protein BGZ76_011921, partial [Entomortierella beljakovae]